MTKVIEGRITSKFGNRVHPITKAKSFHNGTDIAAPIGTPIHSPADCTVASRYSHATGGLTLILSDRKNNVRYGFCHLDDTVVDVGDRVEATDLIAHCGNSGRSTGAHLHFSVKTGGRWSGSTYLGGDYVDSADHIEIDE